MVIQPTFTVARAVPPVAETVAEALAEAAAETVAGTALTVSRIMVTRKRRAEAHVGTV